jgi:hypothetical protein
MKLNKLIFLFLFIILTEIITEYFLPDWIFISGFLTIANRIVMFFSFFALLFCIVLRLKLHKCIVYPLGIFLIIFFCLIALGEIYPRDTTTEPIDILTIHTNVNGKKMVVRKYKNIETDLIIYDTIVVKDYFIFRKIFPASPSVGNVSD